MRWFSWLHRERHYHHHHHHYPHPRRTIWLIVNDIAVELKPNQEIEMAQTLRITEIDNMSIATLDSAGNPVTASFDAAPAWALTDAGNSGASLAQSGDGLTAVLTPGAVGGVVTVNVVGVISGTSFSASLDVAFEAGETTVASIAIVAVPAPRT